jgi:hypothetical protein
VVGDVAATKKFRRESKYGIVNRGERRTKNQ